MKVTLYLMVAALFAGSAWARLGETEAEAQQRYGQPTRDGRDIQKLTGHYIPGSPFELNYVKNGVEITAQYFPLAAGTNVIGQIEYTFKSVDAAAAVVERLLDANSAGQPWTKSPATDNNEPAAVIYRRTGAIAIVRLLRSAIVLRSDAYPAYCQAFADKQIADEKAKANSEALKSVQGF